MTQQMTQKIASVKGPESRYFRLCRSYVLSQLLNCSTQREVIDRRWTKECGCFPMKLCLEKQATGLDFAHRWEYANSWSKGKILKQGEYCTRECSESLSMVEKRHWWSDRSGECSFCSDEKRQCVEALGCSVVPWRALTVGSSQTSAVLGISHRWTTEAFRSRQAETFFFLLKIRVRAFANESMTLAEFEHLSDRSWWHPCAWHLSVKQTRTVGADRALPREAQGPTASPTNQTRGTTQFGTRFLWNKESNHILAYLE